jgi:Cdc6-like AAA superfamily ATPase
MTKLAKLAYVDGKWVASYRGQVLATSKSRSYVEDKINNRDCAKATKLGVFGIEGFAPVSLEEMDQRNVAVEVERFGINERFQFVTDLVTMLADKQIPSVVISGEGGLGKTFTVMKTLESKGLKDTRDFPAEDESAEEDEDMEYADVKTGDYTFVKGFSTSKGLYRTLYQNRNKIVVFDDCDSILKFADALMLLKGALDSYDERWISWNAEMSANDDLPKCFKFTGQVIFITNTPIMKIDQAIRSRSMCVDLAMTDPQKIERMAHIIHEDDFMPEFDMTIKTEALDFLAKFAAKAKEISLRTLISVVKIRNRGINWENLAEYVLTN